MKVGDFLYELAERLERGFDGTTDREIVLSDVAVITMEVALLAAEHRHELVVSSQVRVSAN